MSSQEMMNVLNEALEGFSIDAKCINAKQHRHFAYYDVKLGEKCRINRLRSFSADLALKLRSKSDPIMKPIRDLGIVRLQVVNKDPEVLHFDEFYESEKIPNGILPCLLGEKDDGGALWMDLIHNPHMLVAGSTGSGKSVLLHNLIANISYGLDAKKLFLVDPKGVEFAIYEDLQNKGVYITNEYSTTVDMLDGLIDEMENRYRALKKLGAASIEQEPDCFTKAVVIIDEVSDLMLRDGKTKKFENRIIKLAQKCRAAGIYLILATQRPSVDIFTGLLKANFEGRLSCKVSSRTDSQVILDQPGAESLIGRGDAIFHNRNNDYVRFQVAMPNQQKTLERIRNT